MKDVFEKIKERLRTEKSELTSWAEDMAFELGIDKAIEIVNQVAEEYGSTAKMVVNEEIKKVFANVSTVGCVNCDHKDEYIIELEREKSDRWIPCSERLPESFEDVLVTVRNFEYPQIGHLECGIWYADDGVRFLQDAVIAWQPLPAPYKGE